MARRVALLLPRQVINRFARGKSARLWRGKVKVAMVRRRHQDMLQKAARGCLPPPHTHTTPPPNPPPRDPMDTS